MNYPQVRALRRSQAQSDLPVRVGEGQAARRERTPGRSGYGHGLTGRLAEVGTLLDRQQPAPAGLSGQGNVGGGRGEGGHREKEEGDAVLPRDGGQLGGDSGQCVGVAGGPRLGGVGRQRIAPARGGGAWGEMIGPAPGPLLIACPGVTRISPMSRQCRVWVWGAAWRPGVRGLAAQVRAESACRSEQPSTCETQNIDEK